MILKKIDSFLCYIKAIGSITTADYIFQRYISKKEIISLAIPGIQEKVHLRRNSKDVNVFHQIFIKADLSFLKGSTFSICIDAGANIGLSTIYMKKLFPDARIFCIEPELSNVEMLRLNTKGYAGITVISKALNDDSKGLYFVDPGQGSDSFQTSRTSAGNEAVKIESISMEDLMKEYGLSSLDFVKIDIEGAEDFCINPGAMSWIRQTKLLAVEIHEHLVPGCTKKISGLLKEDFQFNESGEYSVFKNKAFL